MENSIHLPTQQLWFRDFVKRTFDILVSLVVLIVFAPFLGLVAIAIKRETPGPALYRGPRIGRGRKYFQILKFRTMYEDPKSYLGPKVTAQDDPRITPLGHWLRDTKLNEFPQFWNVLKGEMSLVGPRPEDPTIAKTWPTAVAAEILSVRPGITSPASVLYRNEETMLHAQDVLRKYLHDLTPDKMRLDQLYVRYRSFWLDLDSILWTAILLLPKIKAFSPPEQLLFVGPITRLIQRYTSWFLWDFLIALSSITFFGALLHFVSSFHQGWVWALQMALGFALLYSVVGVFLGTNRINWAKASGWEATRLLNGWIISTGITVSVHYLSGYRSLRINGLVIGAAILSLAGFVLIRYRIRLLIGLLGRITQAKGKYGSLRERVLIVGSGRTAEQIAWLLDHPTYSKKFQIVGFIDDDLFSQGLKIYGTKVIGTSSDIESIIEKSDVGLILLANADMTETECRKIRTIAKQSSIKVFIAPDIFGSLSQLDNAPSPDEIPVSIMGFQCQYCIARYANHNGDNGTEEALSAEKLLAE